MMIKAALCRCGLGAQRAFSVLSSAAAEGPRSVSDSGSWSAESPKPVEVYDTTLRDGAQGEGVSFTLTDKVRVAKLLDSIGIDVIEGGFPGSNPKDASFFQQMRESPLSHSRVAAFGMTRRKGRVLPPLFPFNIPEQKADEDDNMMALADSGAGVVTVVGKSWDLHVDTVLGSTASENLAMIEESFRFLRSSCRSELYFDAEHFFDGWLANRQYAMDTLRAARAESLLHSVLQRSDIMQEGGATTAVLCDTRGGTLPDAIGQIVSEVRREVQGLRLGIHAHDDSGTAVAGTLAAVSSGCEQVQGTVNGLGFSHQTIDCVSSIPWTGERVGNADLCVVCPSLALKMGRRVLACGALSRMTEVSRFVYEVANVPVRWQQPFVGQSAFAHKGGMHVHAIQRLPAAYEHIDPALVGNSRRILLSELGGASGVSASLGEQYSSMISDRKLRASLIEEVRKRENEGFQFESAMASFKLLVQKLVWKLSTPWRLSHYRCVILRMNENGDKAPITESIVKLFIGGTSEHHVAEGDGPVHSLDGALRKCIRNHFPEVDNVHLRDYRVRVVNPRDETAARVRVTVDFSASLESNKDGSNDLSHWFSTVGVSENIVDASWQAISDAMEYWINIQAGHKRGKVSSKESVDAVV